VFHENQPDENDIRKLMERELRTWLTRFPVPVMVSSFDATESLIHFSNNQHSAHLMGYIEPETGKSVERWGLLQENELPAARTTAEYLEMAYEKVPFRRREDVVRAVDDRDRKLRAGVRIFRAVIVFIAAIPLAIELIGLGVNWLGYILQGISICAGLYKVAKVSGWIKSSKPAREEAESKRRMEHYYYHCEKNPEGFSRLKCENFEREAKERTAQEAAEIAGPTDKHRELVESTECLVRRADQTRVPRRKTGQTMA